MVLKDNVSTIDSKTKINQEFKSQGQSHTISIFKNEEKQGFLADLNRYWKVLQKVIKKIINIVIGNCVCSIDSVKNY